MIVGLGLFCLFKGTPRVYLVVRVSSILIQWFWNSTPLSFISSLYTCWGTFKKGNPFGFPVFLSKFISPLQVWRRFSDQKIDLILSLRCIYLGYPHEVFYLLVPLVGLFRYIEFVGQYHHECGVHFDDYCYAGDVDCLVGYFDSDCFGIDYLLYLVGR